MSQIHRGSCETAVAFPKENWLWQGNKKSQRAVKMLNLRFASTQIVSFFLFLFPLKQPPAV